MPDASRTSPLIDAFNNRDFDRWSAQTSPDCRCNYPQAPGLDKAGARQYNEPYLRAFPDLRFTVEQEWTVADTHIVLWQANGTHQGPLGTPNGDVAATGRKGQVRGVFITKWRDGKVVREEAFWNQIELMQQLGLA